MYVNVCIIKEETVITRQVINYPMCVGAKFTSGCGILLKPVVLTLIHKFESYQLLGEFTTLHLLVEDTHSILPYQHVCLA